MLKSTDTYTGKFHKSNSDFLCICGRIVFGYVFTLKAFERKKRLFPDHQPLHDRIISAETLLETGTSGHDGSAYH